MKILVVCASNICRSPYVEYLLKRELEKDSSVNEKIEWIKSSAVFNKSKKIHPKAVIALKEAGFEENYILSHKPSYLYFDLKRFREADIIIGMTKFQKFLLPFKYKKKYKTLSEVAFGEYTPIPDPYLAKTQEDYNKVMRQIDKYVVAYIQNLKEENNK